MVDRLSSDRRSWLMSRVRCRHTAPEMRVRQAVHALGLRFRLHRRDLPGKPDLVLPGRRLAVFVHGCFWHRHLGCKHATTPKSNAEFWNAKFEANIARDKRVTSELEALGWRVEVIWECETENSATLAQAIFARVFAIRPAAEPNGNS
ncbi:very short patch repair endonuclease [Pleomorphomonas oryzae]|uniref:very short patch repair endonuclease n=1 Tax=Pleomorphomonas oryzae TaxID=261934 RepID=UPI000A01A630|nr:very short patch repair endonuclease [Pleomorphomonas oryzae]